MNTFDYEFVFDDIVDGNSAVTLTKSGQNASARFAVSIDDSPIRFLTGRCLSPTQADLLDLAVAINFADKLAMPKNKRQIRVHVYLPLRNPEIFAQMSHKLCDLLFWYTGDFWSFHFLSRNAKGRLSERHPAGYLTLVDVPELTELALWSGGLDSLAGLQSRLFKRPNAHFFLIGTGSNNIIRKTQQQAFHVLHHTSPDASGRLRFFHVPISAEYGKRYSQNQTHRARGIVFLLIGAACALVNGNNKLHVYETGIGAINLPLPGGVGRDHSKAVHPISLMDVGDFVSNVAESEFHVENPFIFTTKAEMCRSLMSNVLPIFETISCDRLHREKPIQCGYCSSCILRQQALAAAGIEDQTKYLIPHGRRPELRHYSYWKLMNQQVEVIEQALTLRDAWFHLCLEYPSDLPNMVSRMAQADEECVIKEKLIRLYRTYVREWRSVAYAIVENMTLNTGRGNKSEDKRWQQMHLIK